MNKPSNDFGQVNGAQRAALEGVQTFAEKLKQDRELALLQHDLAWEAEKRRFEPKPEHQFHYGMSAPRLSQVEYRQLRAEHVQRRKEITDRFDEKAKDVEQIKEIILDRFNDNAKIRHSPDHSKTPQRSMRSRTTGRER